MYLQKKWDSKELINEAIDLFKSHDIQKPRLNAELIMVHCMNKNRLELYSNYKKKLTRIEANYFRNLVQRRLRNEPVQYIVGETEFMSLPFKVNRHVLIPRPETEILVEKVLNYVLENKKKDFRILDIGTGSGNIIVSLAKYAPGCRYYASDISRHALDVARDNEQLNEIKGTINFINTKGFEGIKKRKYFHCIVSNPPYIKEKQVKKLQREVCEYEPNLALGSGEDGLNMLKYLIDNAYKYLRKNGMLAMEFGDGQCRSVRNYALKKGKYKDISIVKDLAGKDRIIMMRRK